jgi:large subunit ribosomal protein L25
MANKLAVAKRISGGKGPARRLRAEGKVPGVVYGHGKENVNVALDAKGFERFLGTLRSEAELIALDLGDENGGEKLTLIKELQYHPVSEKIVHVDFFEINPNERIQVTVPLHFVGVPVGVSEEGGMLEFLQRELSVVCLPRDIPSTIEVDISGLGAGAALHVSELKLPQDVLTREDGRRGLVHVTTKTQREEAPPAAEAAEAAAPPSA